MFIFHHPNCLSTSSPSGSDQGQQPDFVFIESYKMNSSWPWSHHKASHAILQDRTRPQTGPGWCSFASINACIIFSKISFFLLHVAHSCSSTNQCSSSSLTQKLWHRGPCLPKLSIVKCHCISGNLARDQKIMVLPQQFNISSSPHCSFSLNFIQPTTHESSFFVVNVISQILSHFIISSLPCIHLGTQGPLWHAVAIFHGLPSTNKQTNDAQLIIAAPAIARRTSQQTMDTVNHRCPSTSLEGLFSNHAQLI